MRNLKEGLLLTGVHKLSWTSRKDRLKAVQATIMPMIAYRYFVSTAMRKNENNKDSLNPKMLVI